MNWPLMRTQLAAAVRACTGMQPADIVWKGSYEENPTVIGQRAVLSTNSVVSVGGDVPHELGFAGTDPLRSQDVTLIGQRKFTWTVLLESELQNASNWVRVLVDRLSMRMWRDSVHEILEIGGMAISDVLGITHRDIVQSGRMVSYASVDFNMIGVDIDVDDTIGSGDWIGEAIIDGTVNTGNADVPVHLDVDARGDL